MIRENVSFQSGHNRHIVSEHHFLINSSVLCKELKVQRTRQPVQIDRRPVQDSSLKVPSSATRQSIQLRLSE